MQMRLSRKVWLTLLGLAAAWLPGVVAWGMPMYQDALFARYPNAAASLPNCVACHEGPSANGFNAFANAFLANGLTFNAALDALDSDGDGVSNGAELNASPATGPGDPNSRPGGSGGGGTGMPAGSSANHTGLWWNPAESGWGINVNHQGDTVFATLFTYDEARAPLWLVMPNGKRQADGVTYTGSLYRVSGPAFDAVPFTPVTAANQLPVGAMSLSFKSNAAADLSYSYSGVTVNKALVPQVFGSAAASCAHTASSRGGLTNYQDLWWNPAESGWGINVAHQNDTLFATLFTYDRTGKGVWLVMSAGLKQADGSYLGDLFVTTGPAFNAEPFTPLAAGDIRKVGTMRFTFADGNNGTLAYTFDGAPVTKSITRQVFAAEVPACSSPVTPVTPTLPTTLSCSSCHGIPPSLGAHGRHLAAACGTCHGGDYTATTVNAATHRNGTRDVLTSVGWNATSQTCANACHGVAPWSPTATLSCTSCHEIPPGTGGHARHGARFACGNCHGSGYSSTTANTATHRNGITEILAAIGWNPASQACANACHGAAPWSPTGALSCSSCHSTPPASGGHAKHSTRYACGSCHGAGYTSSAVNAATHNNGVREVVASVGWNATSQTCANSCHGSGTWSATATLSCSSCHGNPPSTGRHSKHKSRSCGACHGDGYSATTVNPATHINGVKEVIASAGWNPTARTCSNACHGKESWY